MPSFLGKFFGRTIGEGAAFAIGTATAPAIRPLLQELSNETWSLHPVRPPDVGTLANGVAQGQVDPDQAREWAAQQGIGDKQFTALVDIANTGPGVPAAFDLWRRGVINEAGFRRAAKRQGIEPEWIDDLVQTKIVRLRPDVVANAIQQGHLPPGDILPPPVSGEPPFHIPLTEIELDPLAEVAAYGVDEPRLKVEANLSGLPPGDIELLQMWNRHIIDEDSVDAGIREGHRKTKWIPAVKQLRHAVLTASTYATLRLKGWLTQEQAATGGALTGYSAEQMNLLYLAGGRPAAPQQMATAIARGSVGPDGTPMNEAQFLKGIRESNIRPEWGPMLYEIRFAYPPLFQINRLVQGGAITPAVAVEWARKDRYAPEVVTALEHYWTAGGTSAGKEETKAEVLDEYAGLYITSEQATTALEALGIAPDAVARLLHLEDAKRVKKARDQAVDAIHKSYLAHELDRGEAATMLDAEIPSADAVSLILTEWDHALAATRRSLTAGQIKRAYKRVVIDRATALDELELRGYSATDANTYLDS